MGSERKAGSPRTLAQPPSCSGPKPCTEPSETVRLAPGRVVETGFLPAAAERLDVAILSALYILVATAIHLLVVGAAEIAQRRLADPKVSVWMHRVQALTLLAVALWLL